MPVPRPISKPSHLPSSRPTDDSGGTVHIDDVAAESGERFAARPLDGVLQSLSSAMICLPIRRRRTKFRRESSPSSIPPSFVFSPEYFIGLHGRIFEDIFTHAGKIREVELTKSEDVLNGATVEYAPSFMIKTQLDAEFNLNSAVEDFGIAA